MSTAGSASSPYAQINSGIRIEQFDQCPEAEYEVALRGFLRRSGFGHLYSERIDPTLRAGDSAVFAAILDRPWPPWGLGGHTVLALCQIHKVGDKRYGVSPVFADPMHQTNIGLLAAVFKEALDQVVHADGEVNYLVRDGARYSSWLLRSAGFARVNEFFQTHEGRYSIYRASASALIDHLGLTGSPADLLAEDVNDEHLARQAAFFVGISSATGSLTREIVAIDGGLDDSLPPTTTGGTHGPIVLSEGDLTKRDS